jgi:chaperonin GroES
MKIMPFGARVFVELIDPVDEVTARAAAARLYVVVMEENLPRPTEGRVVAIGTDPFIQELVQLGDIVTFSKFAGHEQIVEGHTYRVLEDREIIAIIRPDPPSTQTSSTRQPTQPLDELPRPETAPRSSDASPIEDQPVVSTEPQTG